MSLQTPESDTRIGVLQCGALGRGVFARKQLAKDERLHLEVTIVQKLNHSCTSNARLVEY